MTHYPETLPTVIIDGDLHVAGDLVAGEPDGLPIAIKVTGLFSAFNGSRPAQGVLVEGPLVIQGTLTVAG